MVDLKKLFDFIHEIVMVVSSDYKIIYLNNKCKDLLGEQPGKFIGRKCHMALFNRVDVCENCQIANIEKKHVLILNCDKESENIKNFFELKEYKNKNKKIFIIAPHPYLSDFSRVSLQKKLDENINLFDALELTIYCNKYFNFNKKALNTARKYNKPIIANSDTHFLKHLEKGYFFIDVEKKKIDLIFKAIKNKKYINTIKPMSFFDMFIFQAHCILEKIFIY